MNIWKKILGISLAVGLSVGMSIAPVYADTISILDEITDEETTEDYAEDTSTILARSSYLNLGNVKIQKVSSNEIANFWFDSIVIKNVVKFICHFIWNGRSMEATEPINTGTFTANNAVKFE